MIDVRRTSKEVSMRMTVLFVAALTGCWSPFVSAQPDSETVTRTILKFEPLVLRPYEVAYVHDASCPGGQVLKVTGTIRGLDRKKECVHL
jgi:hypothetical protein